MGEVFIGIDIGGTNVRCVLIDSNLNVIGNVHRIQFKKFSTVQEEVDKNICSLIEEVLSSEKIDVLQVKAIGISLAALFNRVNGCIEYWPNNGLWNGFPLKEYLQKKYCVSIVFEDDANSAALGEMFYGSAKGYDSFAYITVSTGIGCGIVLNGEVYIGTHGWAGELGHIKVQNNGKKCKCGAVGCLQAIASGPALLERAKEVVANVDDLNNVVENATKGETWAKRLFKEAGESLADALTNMVMLLDIPLIVIGGGVAAAGKILLDPLEEALMLNLNQRKRAVEIKMAECGDNGGVLGIVALTVDSQL